MVNKIWGQLFNVSLDSFWYVPFPDLKIVYPTFYKSCTISILLSVNTIAYVKSKLHFMPLDDSICCHLMTEILLPFVLNSGGSLGKVPVSEESSVIQVNKIQ